MKELSHDHRLLMKSQLLMIVRTKLATRLTLLNKTYTHSVNQWIGRMALRIKPHLSAELFFLLYQFVLPGVDGPHAGPDGVVDQATLHVDHTPRSLEAVLVLQGVRNNHTQLKLGGGGGTGI